MTKATYLEFRQPVRRIVAAIAAIGLVACSGIAEVEVYEAVPTDTPAPRGQRGTTFRLGEASLTVSPVETSERLTWIIGPLVVLPALGEEKRLIDKPLQIQLSLELAHGTATVDFSKTALSIGERTLYPFSIVRNWRDKVEGPVTLTRESSPPAFQSFQLHYDIRTTELTPFTLQVPRMQVNGRDLRWDPIAFRRAKQTVTRL